jgi:glycosyltransferase involved in cell wall biosynthesis
VSRNHPPRVLLAAYQCGPGMGSVSQIGWEWYSRLSKRVPTTLVTQIRNRQALAAAGAPVDSDDIIFVDTEWFAGPVYRTASKLFPTSEHSVFLVSSLDFFVYDRAAIRSIKRRMRNGRTWDIVHSVTPVSTVAATRLHSLGLPVVLGPLNSGMNTPAGFDDILKKDSTWLYPIRNLGRMADALVGSTRNAKAIFTATQATVASIPRRYRSRCIKMVENGVELTRFQAAPWPAVPSAANPLRIVFVGRLVPVKALTLLLEAVARVQGEFQVRLSVIGGGPMAGPWRDKADQLKLNGSVAMLGPKTLEEVAEEMRSAHVFCLPSVRESGGAVLLEAMASARPVIAVAFGGPAEVVDDAVGLAIPAHDSEQVIAGIAEALRDVVRNPERWRRRGEEGRRRAEELYSWDAKVDRAVEFYEQVLA